MDFDFSACLYAVNAKIRLSYILYLHGLEETLIITI